MFVDTSISIPSAGTLPAAPGLSSGQPSSALFDPPAAPFAHLLQNSLQQDQQIQQAQEQQDQIGNFEKPRTASSAAKPESHANRHSHLQTRERSASAPVHTVGSAQPASAIAPPVVSDGGERPSLRADASQAGESSQTNSDSPASPVTPAQGTVDLAWDAAGSVGSEPGITAAGPGQAAPLPVVAPSAGSAAAAAATNANSSSAGLVSTAAEDQTGTAKDAPASGTQSPSATTQPAQVGATEAGKPAPASAVQQARVALTMPEWLLAENMVDHSHAASQGSASGTSAAPGSPAAAHNVLTANASSSSTQSQLGSAGGGAHAATFGSLLQQLAGLSGASTTNASLVPQIVMWTGSAAVHGATSPSLTSTPAQSAQPNAPNTPEPALAPPTDPSLALAPADSAPANAGSGDEPAGDSNAGFGSHSSNSGPAGSSGSAIPSISGGVSAGAEIPSFAQLASAAVSAPPAEGIASAASGKAAGHLPGGEAALPSVIAQQSADGPELSPGLRAWNGGDNAQARLVQSAQLGSHADRAEMSIALQADRLGPVQLHAHVSGDQVGASIAVERHDAHAVLSSELPSLHQALADRQLNVQNVTLLHGALSTAVGGDGGGNAAAQQQNSAPRQPAAAPWIGEQGSSTADSVQFTEETGNSAIFDSYGRLSVRA